MVQLRERKRDRGQKTNSHIRAPKQEKQMAQRLGGETVKGSGCGFEKGDVRIKNVMRLEAKCTKNKSFSVTREMIEKIENAAMGAGEVPAMTIEFLDPNTGNPTHDVAVVPTYVLEMLAGGIK